MNNVKKILIGLFVGGLILSIISNKTNAMEPQPQPLVRNGGCPPNYAISGAYCIPYSGAKYALSRIGMCPPEYFSSGNYCVSVTERARMAVPKIGTFCPIGYYSSGAYCVAVK